MINFAGQANSAARKELVLRGGVWKSLPERPIPHAKPTAQSANSFVGVSAATTSPEEFGKAERPAAML